MLENSPNPSQLNALREEQLLDGNPASLTFLANYSFICPCMQFLCYSNKGTSLSLTTFMLRLSFITNFFFKNTFQWEMDWIGFNIRHAAINALNFV